MTKVEADNLETDYNRILIENKILKQLLVGMWADYDHQPYQLGEKELDNMTDGFMSTYDRSESHVVYKIREEDIDRMIENYISTKE